MKLRKKGQVLPMVLAVVVVLFTLANAGANMMPYHWPTKAERQQAAQDELIAARRVRIAVLSARVDTCDMEHAQELARALVYNGQSAAPFAVDYQQRCGGDDVVQKWADVEAHPWKAYSPRS